MGCASSKNAVQEIDLQDGVLVKKGTTKTIHVEAAEERILDKSKAVRVGQPKATSAKSRDSGIQEMDDSSTFITEHSDPNQVQDIANGNRPSTPELQLIGKQYNSKNNARQKSKTILEELEAQGLIQGSKVHSGGSAFDVSLVANQKLEPIKPARLERLKSGKRTYTHEEIDRKMKLAEARRREFARSKSRIAAQLAAHVANAREVGDGDADATEEGNIESKISSGSRSNLPPLPPKSDLPPTVNASKVQSPTSITKRRISDDFSSDLSSLEDGMSITNDVNRVDNDGFFMT